MSLLHPTDREVHRFAVFTAVSTLVLIGAGASVTSTGSGLAVPDWPLAFGTFFPMMEGGVLFEHGHRIIAGWVAICTAVQAVLVQRSAFHAGLKKLAWAAVAAVGVQALLGGLTVLMKLPAAVSIAHGTLAQLFFCMCVALAVMTDPHWVKLAPAQRAGTYGAPEARYARLARATVGVVFVQLLFGATMRHLGAGLAIPDFPTMFGSFLIPLGDAGVTFNVLHRFWALAVIAMIFVTVRHAFGAGFVEGALVAPAGALGGLVVVQGTLGALVIWTRKNPVVTVLHVATGAAILGLAVLLTLRAWKSAGGRFRTAA